MAAKHLTKELNKYQNKNNITYNGYKYKTFNTQNLN